MNQIGNFYIKQVLTVVLKQDVAKAGKGWGVGGNFIPPPPPIVGSPLITQKE